MLVWSAMLKTRFHLGHLLLLNEFNIVNKVGKQILLLLFVLQIQLFAVACGQNHFAHDRKISFGLKKYCPYKCSQGVLDV